MSEEWFKCGETFPKVLGIGCRVLVWDGESVKVDRYLRDEGWRDPRVTHWMPWPAGPARERASQKEIS